MSLESATYINQLVRTNPNGADPKGQGDDHLRMIKGALLNTFPGITGPVTATQAEINALAGGQAIVKPGMIVLWSGTIATIPPGWYLCNGTNGTPNLGDRFVVGAGGSYTPGSTGGNYIHVHTITVQGTGLTVEQIPPHSHQVGTGQYTPDGVDLVGNILEPRNVSDYPGTAYNFTTSTVGQGAAHTHTAQASVEDHRPPYYALAYIMKL